jgi:hypothetical protein
MTTTFSVSNTTAGITLSHTISDADTTLAGNALNFELYNGEGLTVAQAIERWLTERMGDLKAIVVQFQRDTASTTGITVT